MEVKAATGRGAMRAWFRSPAILVSVALAASALALGVSVPSVSAGSGCTGSPTQVLDTSPVLGLGGRYTLPPASPQTLVLFAHGYRMSSADWVGPLVVAARDHGAVAVAVDYRGIGEAPDFRGWPVQSGAQDLIKTAQTFVNRCPTISNVALLGVGMGANASGLALVAAPKRANGSALFNYWVDLEGYTNLVETWSSFSAVGGPCVGTTCYPGIDTYFAMARSDLEHEAGGAPYEAPAGFQTRDVIGQVKSIGSGGLLGAATVHAVADGAVLYSQSREMSSALRALQIPTDAYTVLRGNGGPDDTLITETGQGLPDGLAGYEAESSRTNVVIATGLSALWGMVDAKGTKPSNGEHEVDGPTGQHPAGTGWQGMASRFTLTF